MIKFEFESIFEPEDVVPGDILVKRGSNDFLFVTDLNDRNEEYLCVSVSGLTKLNILFTNIESSARRIKFEDSVEYLRIRPVYE